MDAKTGGERISGHSNYLQTFKKVLWTRVSYDLKGQSKSKGESTETR